MSLAALFQIKCNKTLIKYILSIGILLLILNNFTNANSLVKTGKLNAIGQPLSNNGLSVQRKLIPRKKHSEPRQTASFCSKDCFCVGHVYDCSNRKLNIIPTNISRNVVKL